MCIRKALVALLVALVFPACTTTRYLAQASYGQLDIMFRARDIGEVIADEGVDLETRQLLQEVPKIKRFGEAHHLKPTGSYHTYVGLDRKQVVCVVTAVEPLRFVNKTWWLPVVGHVPYLGWFECDAAKAFAEQLRGEGWDVDVSGASAYSTLGWFDDPILSTMIQGTREDALAGLVNVVLHESVHATLYIDGQTRFNESLAEFASGRLTRSYLEETYGPNSAEQRAFVEGGEHRADRTLRMHHAYEELDALYKSSRTREDKLAEKAKILRALRDELHFRRPINNATLAAFRNYNAGTPEFDALLSACDGKWDRFFGTLVRLKGEGAFTHKNQMDLGTVLTPLIAAKCPA